MAGQGVATTLFTTITSHTADINALSFSTNLLATCSSDKKIRVWNLDSFTELPYSPLCSHTYMVHWCTFNRSGTCLASCSTDGKCILWDVASGREKLTLEHPSQGSIRHCQFAPNGDHIVTAGDDERVCVWSTTTGSLLRYSQVYISCFKIWNELMPRWNYSFTGFCVLSTTDTRVFTNTYTMCFRYRLVYFYID